jgi:hypothetical protein
VLNYEKHRKFTSVTAYAKYSQNLFVEVCISIMSIKLKLMYVKKLRENTRWKVPIRPTLIWGSVSDQYVGLVATKN